MTGVVFSIGMDLQYGLEVSVRAAWKLQQFLAFYFLLPVLTVVAKFCDVLELVD